MKSVATVLREAAELLRREGWCKYTSEDEHGRYCMAGALRKVITGDAFSNQQLSDMGYRRELFAALFSVTGEDVVAFNNYDCRCEHDAIAALEIAADIAEAEAS